MWCDSFCSLSVGTSISEESAASVFMTEEAIRTSVYPYSTLRMEAAIIHGMLVPIYQDTWQFIPEYHTHMRKNSQKHSQMGNFVDHQVWWCKWCYFLSLQCIEQVGVVAILCSCVYEVSVAILLLALNFFFCFLLSLSLFFPLPLFQILTGSALMISVPYHLFFMGPTMFL